MASSITLMTMGLALQSAIGGEGQGIGGGCLSLFCATAQQTKGKASCPTLMSLGLAHLQHPCPGPSLLCCPGEVLRLLSQVLQLVKGKDSSPALMTLGPGLPLAVRSEEGGGRKEDGNFLMAMPL